MAITIIVNISKKVPISGIDYASTSASCTLEGEISAGQDPRHEAARLYAQAEQAVDVQLRLPGGQAKPAAPASPTAGPAIPARAPVANGARGYPRAGRRTLVTPSQLGLINKLLHDTKTALPAVLAHYQVGSLEQLSVRDASELIDELKTRQGNVAQR